MKSKQKHSISTAIRQKANQGQVDLNLFPGKSGGFIQRYFFSKKNSAGFTLIELLVVISIISFLASIMLVAFSKTRIKARDTKRLTDMRQLQTALDFYYNNNNSAYPNPDPNDASHADPGGLFCGGWDVSSYNPFISALQTSGIISKLATDPLNTNNPSGGADCGGYAYRYYRYPAGSYGCDPNKGAFYILGLNVFEGTAPGSSPGWGCNMNYGVGGSASVTCQGSGVYFIDCRNWQNEFQWVIGKFER